MSDTRPLIDPIPADPATVGRNLVVCLDGTNNEFGRTNTNVVRLYQALVRDPDRQIAYYDPGVGTIWAPGTLWGLSRWMQMVFGMAFGLGVTQNIADGYLFLMRTHRPGDRIFLFGFSRGALEARALAGLIHRCGLLDAHLLPLEPYSMRLFQKPGNFTVVDGFRETFSRRVDVAFLGLWDTVTSMGNVWSPVTWPNVARNPSVRRVAHAIAIDERRAFFRQNRWTATADQTFAQVWFAGVHGDVGGGYPDDDGKRLWTIALRWMAEHAERAGLAFDRQRLGDLQARGVESGGGRPDCATPQHDSMSLLWRLAELVPRFAKREEPDGSWRSHVLLPVLEAGVNGRPRVLREGERVHRSAIERFVVLEDYRPPTLVRAGLTLDIAKALLASGAEEWTVPPAARA